MQGTTVELQAGREFQSASGSELQFRHLLDKLPAAAYTCDRDGLITYFNQQALQLWGRAPQLNDPVDRFCGSFKLFSVAGEPISHAECWMALALRTGREYNGEEIIIERPDGSRHTVLAHANLTHDATGRLIGAVNILVDISDRKYAQEAEKFLAAIVESSDDAIVSKSLEGRILSWNGGAQRLFGYSPEEAIGSAITLIIPPERQQEEVEILTRIRRGERIDHYETVRLTKGGRRLDVSLTISPVRDGTGRIVAASKVARDITAQKQSESALITLKDEFAGQLAGLRRLHEMSVRLATTVELKSILDDALRTAAAIEGTDLGLLALCDAEYKHLEIGASLGFDEGFLRTFDRIPPGGGACGTCFQERRRIVVEDTESDPLFAPYCEVARQAGYRAVHSTPLLTRGGKIVGVLSTHFRQPHRPTSRECHLIDLCARQAVDFMESARLYDELREADRRKDEFLATLAHELRNPLAPICSSLQLLRLSGEHGPALDPAREIIERQVNHMVRLVDDLMEVSRITRGKIELRKERVELSAVVATAIETSRPLIDAAGHHLTVDLCPKPLLFDADPVRLAQVVANLLNNAAKYTPDGGQIRLTTRRENGEAVISVQDTGLGISAEMLPVVFDMFAQVDRTRNRAHGGLGIGLTLVRRLVQMHGGEVAARSDGPGHGSEFLVRLPLTQEATQPEKIARTAPATFAALTSRRILIVDDARDAVFVVGRLLEKMGQRITTANSAAVALEQICREQPDLIISDIAMPLMDGYEFARRLRALPDGDEIVLVALTGYGQDSDRQEAKAAGFDYHLVKPVSMEALDNLLRSLPDKTEVEPTAAKH